MLIHLKCSIAMAEQPNKHSLIWTEDCAFCQCTTNWSAIKRAFWIIRCFQYLHIRKHCKGGQLAWKTACQLLCINPPAHECTQAWKLLHKNQIIRPFIVHFQEVQSTYVCQAVHSRWHKSISKRILWAYQTMDFQSLFLLNLMNVIHTTNSNACNKLPWWGLHHTHFLASWVWELRAVTWKHSTASHGANTLDGIHPDAVSQIKSTATSAKWALKEDFKSIHEMSWD